MSAISFDINNGRKLVFEQNEHDGKVIVKHIYPNGEVDTDTVYAPREITAGDFVMLWNMYVYTKDYDIKNDFINPHGKVREEL